MKIHLGRVRTKILGVACFPRNSSSTVFLKMNQLAHLELRLGVKATAWTEESDFGSPGVRTPRTSSVDFLWGVLHPLSGAVVYVFDVVSIFCFYDFMICFYDFHDRYDYCFVFLI